MAVVLTAEELERKGPEWALKPCPFCGSTSDLQLIDDGIHWPSIECCCCGAEIHGETGLGAIAAWNTRPEDGTK